MPPWLDLVPLLAFALAGIPAHRMGGLRRLSTLGLCIFLVSVLVSTYGGRRDGQPMAAVIGSSVVLFLPALAIAGLVIDFASRRRWAPILIAITAGLLGGITLAGSFGFAMLIQGMLGGNAL